MQFLVFDIQKRQQLLRRPITFDLLRDDSVSSYPAWELTYEDLMAAIKAAL